MTTRTIRSISLAAAVAVLLAAGAAQAQRGPNERKAAAHFRQGKAYVDNQLYDKAIVEFDKAYKLVPRALILFHIGRAHHLAGRRDKALASYRKFLADKPDGKVSDEARGYIAEIEKAIADERAAEAAKAAEEEKRKQEEAKQQAERDAAAKREAAARLFETAENLRRGDDKAAARSAYERYVTEAPDGARVAEAREHIGVLTREIELADTGAPEGSGDAPPKTRKVSWLWVGIGAAAIAAGVAADVVPDSTSNGTLEVTDFAGAALYGVGASLILVGVF